MSNGRACPALDVGATPGVLDAASAGETALLRKLVAICGHLSTLASQTTELTPILEILADSIDCAVTVVDPALEILGSARGAEIAEALRGGAGQPTLAALLAAAARNRRALAAPGSAPGQTMIIAPVLAGEDAAGYLLALSPRQPYPLAGPATAAPPAFDGFTEDMRLLAVEHAAMVCGVVLGRDLVVAAAAGRARQELFEALLRSHDRQGPEADRWARHLGLDPSRAHCVMAIEMALDQPGARPSSVELVLTRNAPGAVVASRADEVVAIVPAAADGTPPAERAGQLARACLMNEGSRLPVTGVGIGNPCSSAAGIARSYAEARRALAAGRRMGPGTVSVFAELGIHRLLVRVPDVADLRSFADEVLGVLSDEERSTGIDYLATLSAYFEENGSPARAARRLHVHPNTVGYRIRRAEELTGLSFSLHRDRLAAEVAVEILQGLGGTL